MNQFRAPQFAGIGVATRKRRSQISHRSIPESQPLYDRSPMPSTPLSDEMSKVSSDENIGEANSRGKVFNLNQCISRVFPTSGSDGGANVLFSNGVLGDAMANENKPKKVTLKVGGVTHTIQTKSNSNGSSSDGSLAKIDQSSSIGRARQNLVIQENSYHDHSTSLDKRSSLQGIPWKDFSRGGFNLGKDINRMPAKNALEKQGEKLVPVRKRAPKRRVLDEEFDEDDDAEIRYLKKLKNAKVGRYKDLETESTKYQHSLPRISMKFNSESAVEGIDYEDELLSDGEPEGKKKKQKDLSNIQIESKREMTLTTRQRALLSSKGASSPGMSQIEFPDGLPLPPRKQKEKLSEVEQQTKKAEAAQKRKIQNEKVARELEAEAIRKILSQDSSRKKKEDKIKKRLEELAQEKVANAKTLASNTIRWTMRSTGTIVTFPQDTGLPKIFYSKPLSYPPPREKCAGPSCINPYKYRDSKLKLPLCSLQCYKAIHEKNAI